MNIKSLRNLQPGDIIEGPEGNPYKLKSFDLATLDASWIPLRLAGEQRAAIRTQQGHIRELIGGAFDRGEVRIFEGTDLPR